MFCLFVYFFFISRRHLKTFNQVPRLQQQQQKTKEMKEKNSQIAKYTITNKTQATHHPKHNTAIFRFS